MSLVCEFRAGDEVECIDTEDAYPFPGRVYVVAHVLPRLVSDSFGIRLTSDTDDMFPRRDVGWSHKLFRKVQRKRQDLSIERFLTIRPDQFEEPKKTPNKERKKEEVK